MTGFQYTYILDIDSWTGPSRLSEKPLIFMGNGYDGILVAPSQAVISTADSSSRSPCVLSVTNESIAGTLFSESIRAQRIEGKEITLTQLNETLDTSRVVYKGVVTFVEFSEMLVTITCVEPSLSRSVRVGKIIDTISWPRARPRDVGNFIGVPVGPVIDSVPRSVEFNRITRTTDSIIESQLVIPVDNVEGFTTDAAFIGEESITITSIDVGLNELTATRPKPTEHPRGEPVFMGESYALGIDASGGPSTGSRFRAIEGEDQFPLADPDLHTEVNDVRIARWTGGTPTFKRPEGPNDAVGVEFDSNTGSNVIFSQNALGRMAGYTERNFASIRAGGGNVLRGTASRYLRPIGKLKKILAVVDHTGKRLGSNSDNAVLDILVPSVGSFAFGGLLVPQDLIDLDFLEIAERKARRSVDVPVANQQTTGVRVNFDTLVTSGNPNAGFFPSNPEANLIDGSLNSTGILREPETGGATGGPVLDLSLSVVPADLPASATLDNVRLKFRHGGSDSGFTELDANGQDVDMELFKSLVSQATGTFPANSVEQVDDFISDSPPGATVADLTDYTATVTLNSVITLALWIGYEIWLEIDYTESDPSEDSGSVTNQFDITSLFPIPSDWEEFKDLSFRLTGDGTNFFEVFHMGVILIFEPQSLGLPELVATDIDSDISGDPAAIINELWTNANIGNNAPSTIDGVASTSAKLITNGYTEPRTWGVIVGTELYTVIQDIAREARIFAYVTLAVLRLEYQELIADLPVSPPVLTKKFQITDDPAFRSSDIEQQIKNRVTAGFSTTQLEESRESVDREDAASITAFGEYLLEVTFQFVQDTIPVNKTIDAIFDRIANPFDEVSFSVSLQDLANVGVLVRPGLDLLWMIVDLVEITQIEESLQTPTIDCIARVLRD